MLKSLIIFGLGLNLQAQTVKTDLQSKDLDLKSAVKSCQELSFYIDKEHQVDTKDTTYNHINLFNKKGYFERKVTFSKIDFRKDYFDQLDVLETLSRSEVKQLPIFCTFTYYHYDKQGKLFSITDSYDDSKTIFENRGNIIQSTVLKSDTLIINKEFKEFDAKGNLIKEFVIIKLFTNALVDTAYKKHYWYNTNNKEIKREFYKLYDSTTAVFKIPDETELFEYNTNQQLEKSIKISANLYGEVPTYDTTISYYQKYDSYNHPTEILKGKDRITYTYSYDNKGNWIKKETFINGKLEEYEERVIEYYKP